MSVRFDADLPPELPANDGPEDRHDQLIVDLDGFEGPIDLLLTLARDRKLDITRISILALADQYLGFIEQARALRLELAADYLVMAAWLAYLKSRMLLPPEESDTAEPTGEELAEALAFQLKRLESMQDAAKRLSERQRLGYEVLVRGAPEGVQIITNPLYELSLYELLSAYGDIQRRQRSQTYRPVRARLFSIEDALKRLRQSLGVMPGWVTLQSLLPPVLGAGLSRRSAIASTFLASLELAKGGNVEIRQEEPFAPIHLRWFQREEEASNMNGTDG
jgi:segregation and condensation protein A